MLVAIADSFFFFKQVVIIRFRLLIPTGQVGELLLPHRLLIQSRLIIVHFCFELDDGMFAVSDLYLVGFQLALDLSQQGSLRRDPYFPCRQPAQCRWPGRRHSP